MKFSKKDIERAREERPGEFRGLSDWDVERLLLELGDGSTEALVCELTYRGYRVYLER